MRPLLLALLLATLTSASATKWPDLSRLPSKPPGDGRQDATLIIAIEDYAHVEDVKGARSNGDAWFRWLVRDREVPLEQIQYLRDGEALDHRIRAAMARAVSDVGPQGRLWVVFIGHGVPRADGQPMLVGADAPQGIYSLYSRSLTCEELLHGASSLGEGRAVFVLDASFYITTSVGSGLSDWFRDSNADRLADSFTSTTGPA